MLCLIVSWVSDFDFLATNASVILSFGISMLTSKNANYESSSWREIFISLVDDQITAVSLLVHDCTHVKRIMYVSQIFQVIMYGLPLRIF